MLTFNLFCFEAIEHQYTGKSSYKEHSYRMMTIWLHGLSETQNPLQQLCDALIEIDRKEVSGISLIYIFRTLIDLFCLVWFQTKFVRKQKKGMSFVQNGSVVTVCRECRPVSVTSVAYHSLLIN